MRFENLTRDDKDLILKVYDTNRDNKSKAQQILAEHFDVTTRSIRNWARRLGENSNEFDSTKVLVYDLETSRVLADVWWPGKQFVGHGSLHEDPRIITVAWKWMHEETVHTLRWDDVPAVPAGDYAIAGWGDDANLVAKFAEVYNQADLAIGQNNDNFDKRFLAQRCLVHTVPFNRFVRSVDLMKASKKEFRAPSYSLDYQAKRLGITNKQTHEGISMWRNAQYHRDPEVRKSAIDAMEKYNIGDIITTEEDYLRLIPYIDHKIHFGTLGGGHKWNCPNCGGTNVEKVYHTSTPAGTVQHIMRCKDDGQTFKISATQYVQYLNSKVNGVTEEY